MPNEDELIETLDDEDHLPSPALNQGPGLTKAYLATISTSNFYAEFAQVQQGDEEIRALASYWKSIAEREVRTTEEEAFFQAYLLDMSGFWKRTAERWVMIVPKDCRERVLHEFHDSNSAGQPGAEETQRAIQERLTWDSICKDTRDCVRSCILCSSHYWKREAEAQTTQDPVGHCGGRSNGPLSKVSQRKTLPLSRGIPNRRGKQKKNSYNIGI